MDTSNSKEHGRNIKDACYVECSDCGAKAVVAAGIVNRTPVDKEDAIQRLTEGEWVVNESGNLMCGEGQGKGCARRRSEDEKITDLYYLSQTR